MDHIGGAGMEPMDTGLGHGIDQVGSDIESGLVMDHMSSVECIDSSENMNILGLNHMASRIECMGQSMEHIGLVWSTRVLAWACPGGVFNLLPSGRNYDLRPIGVG